MYEDMFIIITICVHARNGIVDVINAIGLKVS